MEGKVEWYCKKVLKRVNENEKVFKMEEVLKLVNIMMKFVIKGVVKSDYYKQEIELNIKFVGIVEV